MRILYVEDNPTNLLLVQRVARSHEVISYIDGEEALANFERDNPDLVLMDIQLAGRMTGLEVVQKLRSDGYTGPIIAVTAYAMVGDRERCLEAGCDDYIAKPLPIPRLVNLFSEYEEQLKMQAVPPQTESQTEEAPPAPQAAVVPEPAESVLAAQAETLAKEAAAAKDSAAAAALESHLRAGLLTVPGAGPKDAPQEIPEVSASAEEATPESSPGDQKPPEETSFPEVTLLPAPPVPEVQLPAGTGTGSKNQKR